MRYSQAHAAGSGSVPFVRKALAGAAVGAVGLVAVLVSASPALAVGPNTMPARSAVEGADLLFTLTYNGSGPATYNLTVAGTGANPADSTDFTAPVVPTVTFANTGAAAQTITVKTTADVLYENNETLTVTATNASVPSDTVAAVGTITDNDTAPSYALTAAPSPVSESADSPTSTITATLSARSGKATAIAVKTTDGTAKQPGDYTAIPAGTISIPAGSLTGTIPVTIIADGTRDAASVENFTVGGVGDNVLAPKAQSVQVAITDAEGAPTLSSLTVDAVSPISISEGGAGDVAKDITVTLSAESSLPAKLSYTFSGGTAAAGVDYKGPAGSITIPEGSTTGLIPIVIVNDNAYESPAETFNLVLASPDKSADLTGHVTTPITITDEGSPDIQPTLSISDLTVDEGNTGTKKAQIPIALSGPAPKAVKLVVATVPGSSSAVSTGANTGRTVGDDDYETPKAVTIPAGSTTGYLDVTINSDVVYEKNETLSLTVTIPALSGLTNDGATLPARLTIVNDDTPPTIVFNNLSGPEGTTLRVAGTVQGTAQSDINVVFAYAGVGDNAASATDFDASGARTAFKILRGVTGAITPAIGGIYLQLDDIDEATEILGVIATENSAGTVGFKTVTGEYKITDDPSDVPPKASIGDASVKENQDSVDVTVSLALTENTTSSTQPYTLSYHTVDGTAVAGEDYAETRGTLTIPAGAMTAKLKIPILDDTLVEPDEDFWVKIDTPGPAGATLGRDVGEVVIHPEDTTSLKPTISAPATISGATAATITGKAGNGSTVELWGAPLSGGAMTKLITGTAGDTGQYRFGRWIGVGYKFQVESGERLSDVKTVKITQRPLFTAVSDSRGKITLTVLGDPHGAKQAVVVQRLSGTAWVDTWKGATGADNKWTSTVTKKSKSTWTLRAVVNGSAAYGILPGISPIKKVTVK